MGTVSHALEGCTERAVTCLSSLPPWLDRAHSGAMPLQDCWSVNCFFELKKTNFKKIHSLRVGTIIQAGIILQAILNRIYIMEMHCENNNGIMQINMIDID